jgi:hypothetical protein
MSNPPNREFGADYLADLMAATAPQMLDLPDAGRKLGSLVGAVVVGYWHELSLSNEIDPDTRHLLAADLADHVLCYMVAQSQREAQS